MPEPWNLDYESDTAVETPPWEHPYEEVTSAQLSRLAGLPEQGPEPFGKLKPGTGEPISLYENATAPLLKIAHSVTPQEVADAADAAAALGGTVLAGEPLSKVQERMGEMPVRPPSDLEQVIAGAQNVGASTANAFTSPLGLATLGQGALPQAAQRLVNLGMAADMARHVPESARVAGEASVTGTPFEKTVAYGNLGVNIGLPAILAREGLTPKERTANAIQERSAETLPVGKAPGDRGEVGARTPVEEKAAVSQEIPQEVLPEVQRNVEPVKLRDEIAAMSPDEFRDWATKQPNGFTAPAFELGQAAHSQEFVDSLKAKSDEIYAKATELMTGDSPEALEQVPALASQGQFFKEAWQYATGQGSGGEAAAKAGHIPIWSHLPTGELPLAAYKGEVPEKAVPIKVRRADGAVYEAYRESEGDATIPPMLSKIKTSGESGTPSRSHKPLGKGEQIIEGPKTAEEYRAAVEVKAGNAPEDASRTGVQTFYQSGETTTRGGVQYIASNKSVAEKFAQGGEFGRPGAKVKILEGNLNIFDASKESPERTREIIGSKNLQYVEPDGYINFYAFEGDPFIQVRLKNAGYDGIKISEGTSGTSVAVLPHAKSKLKTKALSASTAVTPNKPKESTAIHIQEAERAPAYTLGVAAPGTADTISFFQSFGSAIKAAPSWVRDLWRSAAIKSAPKITDSNRQTGEAAVRMASAPMVGRTKGLIFADKVLEDTGVDADKFGIAGNEDNFRDIKDKAEKLAEAFDRKAREAEEKGDAVKAEENLAARDSALVEAQKVTTVIGKRGSPFQTEAEYQTFLNDPQTKIAIERHKQLWIEQKDPLFRQANDLDPDLSLPTRGKQTGMRFNLKALKPDEPATTPIGRPSGFRQLATLKRRDPFGQKASGAGQAYEGNYHEIMANGFEKELPVAAQHEFIRQLIESGDAKVSDKITDPDLSLKGEDTKGYLMSLKPWKGKFLHVREGLAPEYEAISGLDKPLKIPILTAVNNFFTRQSVAGLAEGSTHASNLMTQVFTGLGPTSNPLINALVKSLGRIDLLYQIPRVIVKGFTNQRERMLELGEIGAAKEPYPGIISKRILNPVDQGVRLVTDDIYKGMAKKGWVEDNETARREFVNQVGQYNKRLQPLLIRKLRESGIQPFATAAETFNIQGLRRLALAPGVKATSKARALALRADIAGGWIGTIGLIVGLNLLLSKKATGPAGTPLGAVGWVGDDKKVHSLNLLRLAGYERGLRITGAGPAIQAKMRGLSNQQAVSEAVKAQTGTALGMVMGPGPRAGFVAATGLRPTNPTQREAPRVPPTDSLSPLKTQLARNIQTAITEANPILSSAAEAYKGRKEGKSTSEIAVRTAEKQFSRYTPRTGMTEQTARALPKIVDSRQLKDYTEDVAKEARKVPLNQRYNFVRKRFNEDGLGRKYRDAAWDQVERKGVLKYQ